MPIPFAPMPPCRARPRGLPVLAAALLGAALLGVTACADRPPAASFVARPQQRLQSAQHWQIVADNVASAVSAYLESKTGKKEPVMLYMMRQSDTPFAEVFLGAMTTRLVNLGHPVAVDSRPDITAVGIDVTLVRHAGFTRGNRTFPGPVTALGAGVGVAGWLIDKMHFGETFAAFGIAGDAVRSMVDETDTELLLTVSLARDGFYEFRANTVYYVNSRDMGHYLDMVADPRAARSLNDLPSRAIHYDLARQPYVAVPAPPRTAPRP